MKIALIGYGKMGKAIEQLAQKRGHSIIGRFGRDGIKPEVLKSADVAIEFTRPEVAMKNISQCLELSIPVVSGTTGWMDQYPKAVDICRNSQGALLVASNFSLGVNLFFEINRKLAAMMNDHSQYDVDIEEIHHTEKLDIPSGTAITLAEQIIDEVERKNDWTITSGKEEQKIHINARREPDVKGTHIIRYKSQIDNIEIAHRAHSREGFALGAVMAAEFLHNKRGVYSMKDVLKL